MTASRALCAMRQRMHAHARLKPTLDIACGPPGWRMTLLRTVELDLRLAGLEAGVGAEGHVVHIEDEDGVRQ